MSYLCSILYEADGESFFQHYVVDGGELARLKTLNHEYEEGCCGQSQCIVCKMGGITVSYSDSKRIKDDIGSLFNGQMISLKSLLENCKGKK